MLKSSDFRPLGMFVGRRHDEFLYGEKTVYQAVFLQKALEDIENINKNEIRCITPFYESISSQVQSAD